MRKYARETAFSMTYAFLMTNERLDDIPDLFDGRLLDAKDREFIFKVYDGVIDNEDRYEEYIKKFAEGFRLERIYRIDRALLLSAMSEMENVKTPAPVVIDEIVTFAKKYSTEKSMSFINGILGSFVRTSPIDTCACCSPVKNDVSCDNKPEKTQISDGCGKPEERVSFEGTNGEVILQKSAIPDEDEFLGGIFDEDET